MNFNTLETKKPNEPKDENFYTSWGCCIGAGLGLMTTFFIGHWLSNTIVGGILGFFAGALIDRNRR